MTQTPREYRPRNNARPRGSRRGLGVWAAVGATAAVLVIAGALVARGVMASRQAAQTGGTASRSATATASVLPTTVAGAAATATAGASATAGAASTTSATADTSAPVPVADPARDQAVPVLMYHHVMPNPNNFIAISPATFDAQMKYLHDHGFHPVSIAQLDEFVYTGKRLPEKPVLITFDDGRMNQYTYAVPILQKYGFTATFFVIEKWVVTTSPTVMHEQELKQLAADGFDVESHTANHVQIHPAASKTTGQMETYAKFKSRYWPAVYDVRTWMQDTLGVPEVTALAYPGGRYNPQAEALVQDAGYKLAFTTTGGYITYKGQNPFALPRFNPGARGTTLSQFAAIVNGASKAAAR